MQIHNNGQASPPVRMKTPPMLFAWLASVTTVLLIITSQFLDRGDHQLLRVIGVVTLLVAAVFIFTPFYLLSKHGKTQNEIIYMQTSVVVQQGLYAIMRHPQYFGYMLLACGFGLLSQHWGAIALAILSISFFYIQALQEEQFCLINFGESYECYIQRVPRFNLIWGIWGILRGKSGD